MTEFDQRLLTERSREGDLLQHRPLAKAIAWAIRDTPEDESLGLALYGAWGQGKSTIGNLVKSCLESEKTSKRFVFVRIDAWKYAHEGERQPLRRHYLLRAYEAAGLNDQADKLRRAFAQKVISHGIDESSGALAFLRSLWERARRKWHYALIFVIALALLWQLAPAIVPAVVLGVLGGVAAVVVAISAMVDTVARVLTTGLTVTTEEDPFRSVEEFDEQFTKLLDEDAADVDRFIFFIDDLDRCKDDLVVEAIETLQAFFGRERCAYIVAADERQLKRAVRATASGPVEVTSPRSVIPMDETFLEKIFQVTVLVPPLYDENLITYARSVSAKTAIAAFPEATREDLLGYLVHPEVVSPRQVRVIINDFLLALSEAAEREAEGETFLSGARLTSDALLLAKMVVLRSHFPWFHRLLFARPELAVWWPETFGRSPDEWTDYQGEAERLVREAAEIAVGESRAFAAPVDDSEHDNGNPTHEARDQEQEGDARASGASVRVEALVDGLRGYLTLTSETVPDDPARVEEFLYLRGRSGFADLTGESGRVIRQVLQTGDVTRLEQVLSSDEADPVAATEAALDRMLNGSRLEQASARRAIQGIIQFLAPTDLSARGAQAVAALYSDGGARKVAEDDPQARRLLVPWMSRSVLVAHAEDAWPAEHSDANSVLARASVLGAQEEILSVIADHLEDAAFVDAVGEVFGSVGEKLAERFTVPASALSRMFGRPRAARLNHRFLLQSASERVLELSDPEEGTVEKVRLAEAFTFDPQPHVGQYVDVDLLETRNGWRVYQIRLTSDESQVWSVERPALLEEDGRHGLSSVLAAILNSSKAIPPTAVEHLSTTPYMSSEEAVFAIGLVASAARDGRLEEPTASLRVLLGGTSFRRSTIRARAVLEAAVKFDDAAVSAHGRDIVAYGIQHAEYWDDDDDVAPAAAVFATLKPQLSRVNLAGVMEENLDPGFGTAHQVRVLRRLTLPVMPEETIEVIGRLIVSILEGERSDEDLENGERALEALEEAAAAHSEKVAQALEHIELPVESPRLCDRGLRAAAAAGLSRPMAPEIVRAGALESELGAIAAVQCMVLWRSASEEHLKAVFEGIAAHPDHIGPDAIASAVERHRELMTPVDQLGAIAAGGAVELAESAARRMNLRRGLMRELFAAAKRVSDLELVERRLTYAEAWSGTSKASDREAIAAYLAEIGKVKTERRFAVVMASLVRFFPAHRDVPGRKDLREAVFTAMKRLDPIKSDQLQELLDQARAQLPLETPSNSGRVARLFARAIRRE